ncbi:hypothetical protein [Streptomyces sp. NRRL WC-3744]|uniref:hypothetical protein n=1 Tax=Streptomyces sp. NRRL WC-3744 TaxID=1463935 RepID=UPI000AB7329F|nr:hypothetical protein [Streptomyces sp. NRRL WC-3744]
MPRRLLPLLVAALVTVAGCTTVSSVPPPDAARPRRSLAPDTAVRPSVLQEPVAAPSGYAALVRTGHGPRSSAGPRRGHRTGPGPVPASPPRAVAPAAPPVRHPRPEHRTPVRRPVRRPRPASRPPAAVRMRDLCRQADGVTTPEIARLCHDTFG